MSVENKKSFLYKVAMARKINAGVSLLCTLLIVAHAVCDTIWMFCHKLPTFPKVLSHVLVGLVALHAILSIVTAILGSGKKTNKQEKFYKKENIKTLLQRMTGMLMVVLLFAHIFGMKKWLVPHLLHTIIHPIFFLVVYVHTAISCSKACITLGIGNAKTIRIIDVVISIFFALLFVVSVVGLCLVMYGSW